QLELAWIHPSGNFRREQYHGPVRAWHVEQPPPQLPAVLLLERSVARAHVIPMGMAGNHNTIFRKAQLDKSIAANRVRHDHDGGTKLERIGAAAAKPIVEVRG